MTTPSRLVEATQFTMQDYEVFKTGTKFDNKFRQAAMELMAKDEKDPKSELNKLGMKEVRRIRVMRDASDMEGKNLTLVYETKTDKRTLQQRAWQEDQKKAQNMSYTRPVLIMDSKKEICQALDSIHDKAAELHAESEILMLLENISKRVLESRLEAKILTEARVVVYKIMNAGLGKEQPLGILPTPDSPQFADQQKANEQIEAANRKRRALFDAMDEVAALVRTVQSRQSFDKEEVLKFSRTLLPPRPPRPQQGKPEQKNDRGPRRQSNGNHARSQSAGPQVEKKPESVQA